MKKIILFLIVFMPINTFSDDHSSLKPGDTFAEFYLFSVTDPQKFVQAIDTFDASDCAKNWRDSTGVNIGLYAIGGGVHSHQVLVVYDSYDQMQEGRGIFASCPEAAQMIKTFESSSDTSKNYNYMTELLLQAGDWTENTNFALFEMKLDAGKESYFIDSWSQFMSSQDISGSYGINRLMFGNKYHSHVLFVGTDSLKSLTDSMKNAYASNSYVKYLKEVGEVRSNLNTKLVQYVKFYPAER